MKPGLALILLGAIVLGLTISNMRRADECDQTVSKAFGDKKIITACSMTLERVPASEIAQ